MKDLIAFLQRHILFLYCIYNWTCTASPTYTYIYEISQCKGMYFVIYVFAMIMQFMQMIDDTYAHSAQF